MSSSRAIGRTFFNTVMLYAMAAAKILFPLLTLPYLTHVLTVECYGAVAYTKSIIGYAQMVIDFGFLLSAVKDVAKANGDKEQISHIAGDTILSKILLAGVACLVVFVASCFIPILAEYRTLLFLSLIPPVLSCFLLDFLFRGIEKMHIVSAIYISMKTLSTLLTMCIIKNDADVLMIPIFDSISSLFAVVLSSLILLKLGFKIRFSGIKSVFQKIKESFFYFTNSVASSMLSAFNTIIIGIWMNDLQEVAYWSVSVQLVGAIQTMYTPLSQGVYPYMVKTKDFSLIKKIIVFFVPLVLIGTVITGIISPTLLTVVSGEEYAVAASVFRKLLPVIVISFPVALLAWPTLGAIDKVKQINMATLTGAGVQVAGLVLLYIRGVFTIENVALLRNISEFAMFLVLLVCVIKYKKQFSNVTKFS